MANTKVTGDVIANGTISTVHLADDAITAAKLDSTATGITFADLAVDTDTLYVDSANNRVGIGTTNPLNKFIVAEGTNQHGIELAPGTLSYIQAYDRATSDYGDLKIDAETIQFGTNNGAERMRINSSGNVGIGDTNPSFILDTNITSSRARFKANTGDANIELSSIAGRDWLISSLTDGSLRFYDEDAASERMRIDSSGQVKITSTGSANNNDTAIKFDINSTNHIKQRITTTSTGGYQASLELESQGNAVSIATAGSNEIRFNTSSTERMRIDSSGYVTIGDISSAPSGTVPLTIFKSGANANLAIQSGGGSGRKYELISNTAGDFIIYDVNGTTEKLNITAGGNIGIGETNPDFRLHVKDTQTSDTAKLQLRLEGNGGNYYDLGRNYNTGFFEIQGNQTGYNNIILAPDSGNVGIGTSPIMGLHVADTKGALFGPSNAFPSIYISPSDENTINGGYGLNTDTADLWLNYRGYQDGFSRFRDTRIGNGKGATVVMVDGSAGNVGIGTTSPESGAKLDVRAGAGGKVVFGSYDANYKVVIEAGDQLNFYNGASSTLGYINYSQTGTPGSLLLSRNLFVEANSNGGVTGTVRIKSNGDVGIGVTSPSQKLDVNGNAKANGFLSGKGSNSITASGTADIINMSGTNGTYTVAVRVAGGSSIYIANAVFVSHASNSEYIKAQDIYNGSNVTLSVSGTNVRITNNGFGTLTWEWSYFFQPFN